ncbi:SNF2-related protein [Streptomyces sp. NPDC087568]|uniref:SNF2-related protein n=1 Tax=unclassified Streptomyces TaxID=2593676 RepID=UPI0038171125
MIPSPRFEPRGQEDLAPSGQGERARANLAALQTLRVLDAEQRPATEQEQQVLGRWSGWGALPLIFEPRPARAAYDDATVHERAVTRWDALDGVREQVRALLSESEWAAARRNTLNAHYTDGATVQAVWGAVRKLGFKGGEVLEPGSGSGNFIGFAPPLPRGVRMTGVEVEPTTAAISRRLYPDAEIISSGLEELPLADGGFDAVVGNVPFGRYKRFDKVHNADLKLSIHDHFVLKSLYATRPGGIVALITSRYTLDAEDPSARERMYRLGDLVGAVRLPARAHRAAAGTDVVTDVLFLRRRAESEEPGDATWLTSRKQVLPGHDEELAVNAYFGIRPEYVLGELRARLGQYGWEVTVTDRGERSPAAELEAAVAAITVEAEAAGLTAAAPTAAEAGTVRPIVHGGTEGALGLDEAGNPTIVEDGRAVPLEAHPDQRDKLVRLIRLKAMTTALYEAEAATPEPGETPELARLRAELRMAYRDYRKTNPPLAKPRQPFKFTPKEAKERAEREGLKEVPEAWKQRTAYAWIDDDPDASLLFGLEEWDDRTNTATEQQVLLFRVLEPRRLPTRANTPEDAIALAMEWDGGRLDMARVAGLLGTDEATAISQCADAALAFRDPEQDGAWEPRHRYLSGNVRTKLAAAREQAAGDPSFVGNVAALEQVQPDDLAPSEIKAKIGAPWIPVDVYDDFLHHLGFEDAGVLHAGGTVWEVRGAKVGDLARTEWGTQQRPAQVLMEALLRQTDSIIKVTWTDSEGRTYVDQDATDAAQEKAKLIAQAFEDWVWAAEDRATRLAGIYNEQFNNLVLPEYSGSPLALPGLISDWVMKEHQNAAIRRIVNEPTALLAHVVGAGKTATMAAGAMELRRTGLAKKPAIVVPNHMLKQWSREFRELYPTTKLLAISASDLSKKRRGKFMARIAGGDWDAVILTHEAFNRVPLRPENQRAYLDKEMESLREQLDVAAESGMDSRTVKQIENALANAEAKLQQQIDSTGDDAGVFLEDTGVDYLFLDEAHEYKNLRTVSAIPGAAIEGSAKATKLHMVLSWLRDTNGSNRVATLATGTPIANSVTEAYVLMRYLAPQLLDDMRLDAFDNWAATFGEVVSQLEPDAKGDGYKYKARFSRFFNVPELMAAYRTFADVRMAEDLDLPTPPVRENGDGQRGETVLIPPTPAQREFVKRLPNQPWVSKPGGVLKALGEGLRASLDLELVDASAVLTDLGMDAGSKENGSKLPYAAEKIAEVWRETKDLVYPVSKDDPTPQPLPGGLQLVFMDEGTPGSTAKHGADLYADLRNELVERGIPRESVRFIHEANTDRKKEKLFADCRAGRVAVLIGSTAKMGTGTNIQDRSVALHHLSYPWRPADMAQRDGRIERRGNLNVPWVDGTPDDVRILYYITERTFDEFRLTTLARKARFISQIQRRDFSVREIEDIGADAISLGMLAALSSGDPAILQLAEATAERARLQGLARSWDREQDGRAQQLADLDDFLARADTALEGMRAALPQRRPTNGDAFAMTVGDATHRSREEAANALGARMVELARDQSLRPGQRVPVGALGGLDFHGEVAFDHAGRRQLRLRFAWGHVTPLGQRDDRAQWQATHVTQSNGRGAGQSLERFLGRLEEDLDKLDRSATAQRGRRDEAAANLRPKEENPYRIHARSKEREERALGKLVVANEKEASLADRVERAASVNPDAAEELNEELAALQEEIAKLRQSIADEHVIQERAQALARGENRPNADASAGTLEEAVAAAEDSGTGSQTAAHSAEAPDPVPAGGPQPAYGESSDTPAEQEGSADTGDGSEQRPPQNAPDPTPTAADTGDAHLRDVRGEPPHTVDLEAILAAPPGTVSELPPEQKDPTEEALTPIGINHDAEGTDVRRTRRGEQKVREALHDNGFRWSRRQQKWYQPRDTPFEEREEAVRGLRAVLDELGAAYTYNGPEPKAEPEEAGDSPAEPQAEFTTDTPPAEPAADEQTAPQTQPEDARLAADTALEVDPSPEQLGLFRPSGPDMSAPGNDDLSDAGSGETGQYVAPPAPEVTLETETTTPGPATEEDESVEEEQTDVTASGSAAEPDVTEPRPITSELVTPDDGTPQPAAPAAEPEEMPDPDEGPSTTLDTQARAGDEGTIDAAPDDTEEPDTTAASAPTPDSTDAGEMLPVEDPPVPDWYVEDPATDTPIATGEIATDDLPTQPEAQAARSETAAPDRTEETPMATPATEPAEAPPARFVTPARVQEWDERYHLHLSGSAGQEPDSGEVRFGRPEGESVLVATLHRSAANRWFARLAIAAEGVPDDVTPPAATPQEAARQGAQLWSYTNGQPYGDEAAAFRRQGPVSRSDALRTELGRFLNDTQQAVQTAAAQAWPSTYGRLPGLQHLGELFDGLQPWQRPDSPAGTANGALQLVEQLEALQQAADTWRESLPPGTDARRHMAFPLARLAGESAHLQQQIAATVEEVGAERAATRTEEAQQLAAPAAEATPEPSREETAPEPAATTGGERLRDAAETAVPRTPQETPPSTRPEPPTEDAGDSLQARVLVRAAAAPSREQQELPLWTGTDLPTGSWREEEGVLYDAYGAPQWRLKTEPDVAQPSAEASAGDSPAAPEADAYEPVDIKQAFTSTVAEAWADIVPPEHGTVEDLLEGVDVPLRELEEQWQRAVPAKGQVSSARADQDEAAPPQRDPQPVNEALRQANAHAAALEDFPEWQKLQTVRGAATHLWNVLREKAGTYFEQLSNDVRVQGFWRTVSIRTTSKIAEWAQTTADRVRRGRPGGDLPTAEALLKLSDAALTYSTPGIARPDHPAPDGAVAAEVQPLRTTLRTGAPVPYGTREEAVQASREIAGAFQRWRETPMGQELTTASEHPRVVAFRQAWQRLPCADLPDGPGTAAGPYGEVGRNAQQLVERAEAANAERAQAGQPPRFAPAGVEALRALATLAEYHGGRLAVTLPPGLTGPAAPRAATPQIAAPPPRGATPTVPAPAAGSRGVSA